MSGLQNVLSTEQTLDPHRKPHSCLCPERGRRQMLLAASRGNSTCSLSLGSGWEHQEILDVLCFSVGFSEKKPFQTRNGNHESLSKKKKNFLLPQNHAKSSLKSKPFKMDLPRSHVQNHLDPALALYVEHPRGPRRARSTGLFFFQGWFWWWFWGWFVFGGMFFDFVLDESKSLRGSWEKTWMIATGILDGLCLPWICWDVILW